MSCMSATISPVSLGLVASVTSDAPLTASASCPSLGISAESSLELPWCSADAGPESIGVTPDIGRSSLGLSINISLTCSVRKPAPEPYLEIQPEILWIWTYAQNDVYSNTTWGIN